MTNSEIQALIDKAVVELKLTTVGYINKHWTVPPPLSHWGNALTYLGNARDALDPVVPPPPPPPALTVTQSIPDGATLTAPIFWTATPSAAVTKVEFFIDTVLKWTEFISPYFFNGDGNKFDPATLTNGVHILQVVADGAVATANVTVNVVVPPPPPPSTGTEGRVQFCMYGTSQVDSYVVNATQERKDWCKAHWQRMIGWLDQVAAWHPGVWRYDDMLAIYTTSSTATQHPDWILKDASGNKLTFYSSVQYLADPGNPAYQDFKAAEVASFIAKGYKGCHCDDVNLDKVSNPAAINPRTGQPYTLPTWQKDMADLMTKVRAAASPPFEIVHNSLWWAGTTGDVQRCIKQADVFELERGFNDTNYTPAKIEEVWAFVDTIHSWGVGANHLSEVSSQQAAHFNYACSLLSSNGKDFAYGYGWRPDAWDPMYDLNLGAAKGPRVKTGTNIWRRDFERGYAIADLAAKTGQVVAA